MVTLDRDYRNTARFQSAAAVCLRDGDAQGAHLRHETISQNPPKFHGCPRWIKSLSVVSDSVPEPPTLWHPSVREASTLCTSLYAKRPRLAPQVHRAAKPQTQATPDSQNEAKGRLEQKETKEAKVMF